MSRAVALAALVLLLTGGLAGCLSNGALTSASVKGVSQPVYDLNKTLVKRLALKTADGPSLDLAVWMPDSKDGKYPVIVDIGPYFGNLGGDMMTLTAIDKRMADYFVPRGYAFARASVRGTGESEGCYDLGGKTEQKDAHDIVEFLGSQPWSNGNVAVFGKSADGTTPWEAAITQPSHLKTIVPISGITDWYRYMYYEGTTLPEELGFNTQYYLLVDDDVNPGAEGTQGVSPPSLYNPDAQHAATKNLVRTCDGLGPQTVAQTQTDVDGDHGTPFWQERDYEPQIGKIQVPVFMVHGLQDWNVKMDNQVPLFEKLAVPKALWLGQWEHNYPDVNTLHPEWSRHDWNETLLVWFDHWLKNVDNDWQKVAHVEAEDPIDGSWRTFSQWPPVDAHAMRLNFTQSGALTLAAGEGAATFTDPLAKGYQFDAKTGGAAFVTGAMPSNITFFGRPTADIHLTIDRPGANLGIALYDVDDAGTWKEIDHGMRELRHRESRETGSDAPMGAPFNTTLMLYPQGLTIPAGHKLGVVLSAEMPAWIVPSPFAGASYAIDLAKSSITLPVSDASTPALAQSLTAASAHDHAHAVANAIATGGTIK